MVFIAKTKIALIPSYEPDKTLVDIVNAMHKAGFYVVIVDDGSGCSYDDIFLLLPESAYIIRYHNNMGKGYALKEGMRFVLDEFRTDFTIVTMDSDGQHTPSDALNICIRAEENPGCIILGSRNLDNNSPLRSRFGNCITRNIFHIASGLNVYDTQTGLRAFDSSLISMLLDISGERYEYEMNVLLEAAKRDIPVIEVAISTIYINGNSGSHFSKFKDSFRIYREIIRFSMSSLICFGTDYGIYSLMTVLNYGIVAANITARLISMTLNFCINYKLVFKKSHNLLFSAVKYFFLAACIMVGNTALLSLLTAHSGINPFFSKIITELVFFAFSFIVQRTLVFGKGKKVV